MNRKIFYNPILEIPIKAVYEDAGFPGVKGISKKLDHTIFSLQTLLEMNVEPIADPKGWLGLNIHEFANDPTFTVFDPKV